uniref:Putative ADP-ribosylation factor GTPase-activating protein AGD11 n=1 Tax=Rhizophora mucronata TaxID=61149 RepID=A0A2P2LN58_RHIMU
MSIHSNWSSTSPHSTVLSLSHMFWTSLPYSQIMWLSRTKQFCLLGLILVIMVPGGRSDSRVFRATMNGAILNSAFPILSSRLNVSLSYTSSLTGRFGSPIAKVKLSFHSGLRFCFTTRVFSFCNRPRHMDIN